MTADAFLAWATEQPEGGRYELQNGEVVTDMAPERTVHVQTKFEIAFRLRLAVEAAGLACMVMTDGASVRIDERTVYEPDALLRCGPPLRPDSLFVDDPMVIVEVGSPSTSSRDTGVKLADYFRVASVRHYVFVDPNERLTIHHERGDDGRILTRIVRDGSVRLDPPGVTLDDFWPKGLTA